VVDKEKRKGILIGDPRVLDENRKILSWEVVAEKTSDGGETLKITIKSSNTRWHVEGGSGAKAPVLCIADGPGQRRGWSHQRGCTIR
jgi:hypothetical protein